MEFSRVEWSTPGCPTLCGSAAKKGQCPGNGQAAPSHHPQSCRPFLASSVLQTRRKAVL